MYHEPFAWLSMTTNKVMRHLLILHKPVIHVVHLDRVVGHSLGLKARSSSGHKEVGVQLSLVLFVFAHGLLEVFYFGSSLVSLLAPRVVDRQSGGSSFGVALVVR